MPLLVAVIAGVFRAGAVLPADRSRLIVIAVVALTSIVVVAVVRASRSTTRTHLSITSAWRAAPLLALSALAVWAAISASWSLDPGRSLWVAGLLGAAVLFGISGRIAMGSRGLGYPLPIPLLAGLGSIVAAASLIGLAEDAPGWTRVLQGVVHAQGPFGYANALAGCMVLTLPASLGMLSVRLLRWSRTSSKGRLRAVMATGLAVVSAVLQVAAMVASALGERHCR